MITEAKSSITILKKFNLFISSALATLKPQAGIVTNIAGLPVPSQPVCFPAAGYVSTDSNVLTPFVIT